MKLLPVVGPSPLSVNPIFEIGPMEPRYSEYLVFEGICVDEKGAAAAAAAMAAVAAVAEDRAAPVTSPPP